jgi:xanthine dehydrogenase molybdopterin-binding subunit B
MGKVERLIFWNFYPDSWGTVYKLIMFAVPDHNDVTHVIKGSFDVGAQYHFTMETQQCVCVPTEDGMDVYPSTQWMDLTQLGIAQALAVPENRCVLCIFSVTDL